MHLSRKPPSKLVFPIRAVEDHHVDRTDVEEQQCLKLTVTNCSIGLISLRPVSNMFTCLEREAAEIQKAVLRSDNFLRQADLDDLVTLAYVKHPIPFRTGP